MAGIVAIAASSVAIGSALADPAGDESGFVTYPVGSTGSCASEITITWGMGDRPSVSYTDVDVIDDRRCPAIAALTWTDLRN